MQAEKPNISLLIFLVIFGLGLLILAGGFDDAAVRDLNNQQDLSLCPRNQTNP